MSVLHISVCAAICAVVAWQEDLLPVKSASPAAVADSGSHGIHTAFTLLAERTPLHTSTRRQ